MAVRAAAVTLIVAVAWWVAGLDRRPADPRSLFSAEEIARADSYQHPKYLAAAVSIVLGLAVLALLAFTPVGERLLGGIRRMPWPLAAVSTVAAVLVIRVLIRLPLSFWRGHVHEKAWGFSTQSAGGWFIDLGKSLAVSLVLMAVVWLGFVWLLRTLPRTWPLAAAGAAAILTVLLTFFAPVVFEPIFNRFTPLADARLAGELRTLADRAGVPVKEVLVADASRRTSKENAYVSGFGSTRRLVVYDTLLEKAEPKEVVLVAAHELGHRRLRHVELGTLLGALAAMLTVFVVWLVIRSGVLPSGARDAADPRFFPAVLLILTLVSLAAQPLENRLSRTWERAADRFSLELTHDHETYVSTERGLAIRNLSDLEPGPAVYRFFFTHPAPAERIALGTSAGDRAGG